MHVDLEPAVNTESQTCMGVATTTDTTDSVRTSFGRPQNLYGMSVQVLAEKKTFLFTKESFKNGQAFNESRYNFEKKSLLSFSRYGKKKLHEISQLQ